MTSGQMMSQGEGASGFQPRYDAHEQPVQKIIFGECKCPGCKYPKRKEGDKIHDFCSRTCAKKFNELQSSFHQQKVAATKTGRMVGGGLFFTINFMQLNKAAPRGLTDSHQDHLLSPVDP